jgi:CRP-like cAMP-binding protein
MLGSNVILETWFKYVRGRVSRLLNKFGLEVKQGEYLFHEGDQSDTLYMIDKGEVEVTKYVGKMKKTLSILKEGEFVGEMSAIDSLPRSADAIALTDCHLIRMDKKAFNQMLIKNHKFAISFIQCLSERLRFTNESLLTALAINNRNSITAKIYSELLKNGKKDKTDQWILLEFEKLIATLTSDLEIDNNTIMQVLDSLDTNKEIIFKKDSKGITWIAYEI